MNDHSNPPSLTSFDDAPDLMDGAERTRLSPADCDLDFWISEVAQGTWSGLVNGHRRHVETPEFMRRPNPFRAALIEELAFRSVAEEKATRAIATLVELAPDILSMEFYATQLIDEARHARVFRHHLVELGVAADELDDTIQRVAGDDVRGVLEPLEAFAFERARDRKDYLGGALILTVLVEGVLAPMAELSERKWRPIDPAAADIERGAGIDEIRHLTVGTGVLRDAVHEDPSQAPRLRELIEEGQRLWGGLPVIDTLLRRETLFQQGLEQFPEVVGDYEIVPGRRLLDTTVDERLTMAVGWSTRLQQQRLAYMGLTDDTVLTDVA